MLALTKSRPLPALKDLDVVPSFAVLAEFVAIVLGLFLIPGPAVILTLARSSSAGPRVGVATALGIVVGDLVHTCMATLGLSAMLMTSALAFMALKYAGVAYLVVTGIRLLIARASEARIRIEPVVTVSAAFRQAVLTEVLNPKTALFFLSFLPQFVRPGAGPVVAQLAMLGFVFVAMDFTYLLVIVMVTKAVRLWFGRPPKAGRRFERMIGAIYIAFGLRIAFGDH